MISGKSRSARIRLIYSGIEAELAATADYDVENDVAKAKRRVTALRRKLDFPSSIGRDQQSIQFAVQTIENQLN